MRLEASSVEPEIEWMRESQMHFYMQILTLTHTHTQTKKKRNERKKERNVFYRPFSCGESTHFLLVARILTPNGRSLLARSAPIAPNPIIKT